MSEGRKLKTEHGGAKNGGGFWGEREEAKKCSRKKRRSNNKTEVRDALRRMKEDSLEEVQELDDMLDPDEGRDLYEDTYFDDFDNDFDGEDERYD